MSDLNALLKPGQRIFVAGSINEPTALLEHLGAQSLPRDLEFVQFPLAGYNQVDFTSWNDTASILTFFMTPTLARADRSRVHFLPMQMRAVYDYLSRDIDIALIQVARDAAGVLRVGPNVDFVDAALASAHVVIAELNHAIVAPAGCPQIAPTRIDWLLESNRPLFSPEPADVDETARRIGGRVAELVADGDCIQTGIGAIPAAILGALADKHDLGMHGGLIDEGGMQLIRAGNMTGARKTIDRGCHVTGIALGGPALMDWLAGAPEVVFRGANHTHEVSVIRQIDNFVSVNSAVEIDLYGQVNAEVVAGRQISGTGGSVDFMRGARASRGGRSIIAMTATARGGAVSRIVTSVNMVTALRTDVDMVVTEFGVACLDGYSVRERARALAAIAAPEFRDALMHHAASL